MQKDIELIVKSIKSKIAKLTATKDALYKENGQLKNKLANAMEVSNKQTETIEKLNQKVQALQLLQTTIGKEEKKELHKTIDKHIQEINKTITLLSE